MKKIILSLGALLSVGLASAQSYPKQPDRSVVTYIEYKKVIPVENDSITRPDGIKPAQADSKENGQAVIQHAASVNTNKIITENSRNINARKE